jgi:hypothetical protein
MLPGHVCSSLLIAFQQLFHHQIKNVIHVELSWMLVKEVVKLSKVQQPFFQHKVKPDKLCIWDLLVK